MTYTLESKLPGCQMPILYIHFKEGPWIPVLRLIYHLIHYPHFPTQLTSSFLDWLHVSTSDRINISVEFVDNLIIPIIWPDLSVRRKSITDITRKCTTFCKLNCMHSFSQSVFLHCQVFCNTSNAAHSLGLWLGEAILIIQSRCAHC